MGPDSLRGSCVHIYWLCEKSVARDTKELSYSAKGSTPLLSSGQCELLSPPMTGDSFWCTRFKCADTSVLVIDDWRRCSGNNRCRSVRGHKSPILPLSLSIMAKRQTGTVERLGLRGAYKNRVIVVHVRTNSEINKFLPRWLACLRFCNYSIRQCHPKKVTTAIHSSS